MLNDLEVNVRRSQRKTLSIYVERDGSLSVLAPLKTSDQQVSDILKKKEYLIYKHYAYWRELNEKRKVREIVSGQSFLYLGRHYTLEIVKDAEEPFQFRHGRFYLRGDQRPKARKLFVDFYKQAGSQKILHRLAYYKGKISVEPSKVRILDLKNRWASCSPKGNLNFHWKCSMAPLSVLDYIIVHELVHLIHKRHSRQFWNDIDKVLPNYLESVSWLESYGASMDL